MDIGTQQGSRKGDSDSQSFSDGVEPVEHSRGQIEKRDRANRLRLKRYEEVEHAYRAAAGSDTRRIAHGQDTGSTPVDVRPINSNIPIGALGRDALGSSTRRMVDDDDMSDEEAQAPYRTKDKIKLGRYDVTPERRVIGAVTFEDLRLWTKTAAEFIRSHAGITATPDEWVGKHVLGQGGFGMAGLWEKIDPEGNVVDVSVWFGV